MTRRKTRRLHSEAQRWYNNGVHWDNGGCAAPSGSSPHRIAFDAGREANRTKTYHAQMPVEVWALVLAEWMRSY